jgi:glycerol-3-phosphate cytidylyltransferase
MPRLEIGYARGAFDLFHVGHLNIIRQARENCDHLIVGVVSDDVLARTKRLTPVVPLHERLEIVRAISGVDEAIVDDADDVLDTWRTTPFTRYFKGDDWRGTTRGLELESAFGRIGVDVVYFPYTVTTSSTRLRQALEKLA